MNSSLNSPSGTLYSMLSMTLREPGCTKYVTFTSLPTVSTFDVTVEL